MPDFQTSIEQHKDLPIDAQIQAGKPVEGAMDDEHEKFMQKVLQLIDNSQIDLAKPESLLNKDVYDKLSEEWRNKTDAILVNVVDLLRHIVDFRISEHTPDQSPQLQTMIEQLWEMKQRVEQYYDVFKL